MECSSKRNSLLLKVTKTKKGENFKKKEFMDKGIFTLCCKDKVTLCCKDKDKDKMGSVRV